MLSFHLENRRRRSEERNAFGRLMDGVMIESITNETVLNRVTQSASIENFIAIDVEINCLQMALTNYLTYTYAPAGLITAMAVVSAHLLALKNIFEFQRINPLAEQQVEDLKSYTNECGRLIIEVLQPQIELLIQQFRVEIKRNDRSREVDERIEAILRSKMSKK